MRHALLALLVAACGSDTQPNVPADAPGQAPDAAPPGGGEPDASPPGVTPKIEVSGEVQGSFDATITASQTDGKTTITLVATVSAPVQTVGFAINVDGAPAVKVYDMPNQVAAGVATSAPAKWRMTLVKTEPPTPIVGAFASFELTSATALAQGGTSTSWMVHGSGDVTLEPDRPDEGSASQNLTMHVTF